MPNPDDSTRVDYSFKPGDIVGGNYRIINFIGKGAMGKVYRAQHEMMPREYALKTLNENQVTEESWRRFQVEAQSIARMSHPNVVVIYNLGIHNGFLPYYVMDLLNGESLFDRLNRVEVLNLQEAIPIFTQVCDGLGYAHKKGIVHRDIKPDNIFLLKEPEPSGVSVKIVDFGIAKLSDAKDPKNQQLTKIGEVFGTPFYMSPEQCMGLRVDGRSDIYSLGCALFETLTGTPPFRGINSMETMMMHQNDVPPTLEKASHGTKFPESAEFLIAKTLAKEPMDRYQSMEQLKQDLNKILEGKDLNALPYLNLNESRGQANSNETLWLTGKNESSAGRHGQSTDRETMFVDPTGPQDKLRSTASGAYIDRGESAGTTRITRPYTSSYEQEQSDTGSQGETGSRRANRSLNIFIALAATIAVAGGGACAYFILKSNQQQQQQPSTSPTKSAINSTSPSPKIPAISDSVADDWRQIADEAEVPAKAPPSINDKAPYSSIKLVKGKKIRVFEFPRDILLGRISTYTPVTKEYSQSGAAAKGRLEYPAETKLLFLPSQPLAAYPLYLKRFRTDDFETVSLRLDYSNAMIEAMVKWPELKDLRLIDAPTLTASSAHTIEKIKTLKILWIENCSLTGNELTIVKSLPRLKTFAFKRGKNPSPALKALSQNKNIEVLNLENTPLTSQDLAIIANFKALRYLNIVGTNLNDCDLRILSLLTNLEELHIKSSKIPSATAQTISRLPKLQRLYAGTSRQEIELRNDLQNRLPDLTIGSSVLATD